MPPADDGVLSKALRAFEFRTLFVEGLGWNHDDGAPITIGIEDEDYTLSPIAEKAAFAVYECSPDSSGAVPPHPIRRKIESRVAKLVFEHLIIYVDGERSTQVWQWVKRQYGQAPVCREQALRTGQTGAPLLQAPATDRLLARRGRDAGHCGSRFPHTPSDGRREGHEAVLQALQ